jgi:hypothetical protein
MGRLTAGQLKAHQPGLRFWGHQMSTVQYLGLLGDIQHQLELFRYGQVFLRRFLRSKEKRIFH